MDLHPQNDWDSVHYDIRFDDYWIEAGGAKQRLFFCPWCGQELPPSQRDRWFDELELAGIDPNVDDIPDKFQSGAWRGAVDQPAPERLHGPVAGRYIDFFDLPDDDNSGACLN